MIFAALLAFIALPSSLAFVPTTVRTNAAGRPNNHRRIAGNNYLSFADVSSKTNAKVKAKVQYLTSRLHMAPPNNNPKDDSEAKLDKLIEIADKAPANEDEVRQRR